MQQGDDGCMPDILLTITVDISSPEIQSALLPNEQAHHRPVLCQQWLETKVQTIKAEFDVINYAIGQQKRGLPYCHVLIKTEHKNTTFAV